MADEAWVTRALLTETNADPLYFSLSLELILARVTSRSFLAIPMVPCVYMGQVSSGPMYEYETDLTPGARTPASSSALIQSSQSSPPMTLMVLFISSCEAAPMVTSSMMPLSVFRFLLVYSPPVVFRTER